MPSRKGKKNKRTLGREVAKRMNMPAMANADPLLTMEKVVSYFNNHFDEEIKSKKPYAEVRQIALDAMAVAAQLAPYKYPKYSTVKVITNPNQPTVRKGATKDELVKEIIGDLYQMLGRNALVEMIEHMPIEGVAKEINPPQQ